ncbi:MAG: hypothetical protein WBA35_12220, partial [Litorimonas sp.]
FGGFSAKGLRTLRSLSVFARINHSPPIPTVRRDPHRLAAIFAALETPFSPLAKIRMRRPLSRPQPGTQI